MAVVDIGTDVLGRVLLPEKKLAQLKRLERLPGLIVDTVVPNSFVKLNFPGLDEPEKQGPEPGKKTPASRGKAARKGGATTPFRVSSTGERTYTITPDRGLPVGAGEPVTLHLANMRILSVRAAEGEVEVMLPGREQPPLEVGGEPAESDKGRLSRPEADREFAVGEQVSGRVFQKRWSKNSTSQSVLILLGKDMFGRLALTAEEWYRVRFNETLEGLRVERLARDQPMLSLGEAAEEVRGRSLSPMPSEGDVIDGVVTNFLPKRLATLDVPIPARAMLYLGYAFPRGTQRGTISIGSAVKDLLVVSVNETDNSVFLRAGNVEVEEQVSGAVVDKVWKKDREPFISIDMGKGTIGRLPLTADEWYRVRFNETLEGLRVESLDKGVPVLSLGEAAEEVRGRSLSPMPSEGDVLDGVVMNLFPGRLASLDVPIPARAVLSLVGITRSGQKLRGSEVKDLKVVSVKEADNSVLFWTVRRKRSAAAANKSTPLPAGE